jgi:UDP-N-acetylmuramoylalanine--D-glutamate ligase
VLPEQITILDSKEIQEKAVRTISGEQYLQDLADYDLIFKSAGIPYFPEIQAVADKVLTQVQFFFDHYQGKVIAITASKGKTTMTSLAGEVVKNAGYRVKVVGNIGKPVLEEIDFETEYDYVVIELSSYMLQTLKKQNFISILGAIFPEHLDRHGGMEEYVKSKLRILEGSEVNIVFSSTVNNPLLPFAKLGVAVPLTGDKTLLSGEGTEYYWDSDFFYV